MKKTDFLRVSFYVLISLCGLSTPHVASAELKKASNDSTVLAPSYVLMDADTGRVLAARKEHERRFPASTTKTLTALTAIENADLNQVVTVGPNPPKTGESSVYLQQGETFALRELLEAALIKSANDSCVAIAEGVAGTEQAFVEMMNREARKVGAKDSHFVNPHGLHDPNHYTTAYDLAVIARAAMKHPEFNEIISTRETTIHGNARVGAVRTLRNRNRLLFRWAECDGVKTGYTRQAGRCLIASATRVNPSTHRPWRLIGVVMHAPDSWTDARHLLEYGFQKYSPVVVARGGETLAKLDVQGGSSQVRAVAAREIRLPLKGIEKANLQTKVRSLAPEAPVKKDQVVAQLEWSVAGKKIGEVPLVARDAVGKSLVARVVPAAGHMMPSHPLARWSLYVCATLGILCIILGWKVRAHERKREWERARRHAARRLVG
jgi:D-alanyl-D-alanine carboxypeptidase (penicillin-binding protein 5/6)